MTIFEKANYLIETIEKAGFEAYQVGGCVRDFFMKRKCDDIDITTSAKPGDLEKILAENNIKYIETGLKHGTVTAVFDGDNFEITTYRTDGEYIDNRHPENVSFVSNVDEDLSRRDFTINAMAYNDTDGFVDEFNGLDDLDAKIIRCVGEPELRFTEDALRMMRAIRFSAQLGFTIDEATWNAIKKLAPSISKISMERVHVELGKTLMSTHPDYVAQYSEAGLFEPILPVIDNSLKSRYKRKILATLQHTPDNIYLRYAALFITSTPDEAAKTLRALKLDNKTVDTVSKLVKLSKIDIEETEPAVRTALNQYGRDFLPLWHELMMAVIQASEDITGISNPAKVKHLLTLKRLGTDILARGDCFTIKALDISGNDLIEYGLQGHEIGETLKSLLDIVIENPKLNDKATLIAMIEHIK